MTLTAPRAAVVAGVSLAVVYAATVAPSVTFWDAGEFIAAARTLGIPHPPGTPLFVVLLAAWARVLGVLPFALATNLFSSACTAAAVGITAYFIARATGRPWAGLAGAVAAGAMSTVWQNATETEVYAASLLLAVAAVVVADAAGRNGDRRYVLLSAYLLALAVPLHLSALVAAPVAVLLVADRSSTSPDWPAAALIAGASVIAAGVGRMSAPVVVVGVAIVVGGAFVRGGSRSTGYAAGSLGLSGATMVIVAIAFTALGFLIIRSRFDPGINQGNPRTWSQLAYVVARRQYDVAGLWPRRAPIWLQLANWFEYADWQWALSFAPGVIPSVARVAATCVFAGLGLTGAAWHKDLDRRTWRAVLLLFVCGSLGVIVYLNLRAGRSFGWSFVSDDAAHEARDRDYFFTLGFWAWGIWAGMGAVFVSRRVRRPWMAVAIAALPVVLNWSVVTRRSEPEASLPREVARQLLSPLPPRAVLFVEGDNDTYPLWYAQQVEAERRDVTVVTLPLLAAPWYTDELRRRYDLGIEARASNPADASRQVADDARRLGRPVAAANTLEPDERALLAARWRVLGVVSIADSTAPGGQGRPVELELDSAALRSSAASIDRWRAGRSIRQEPDPINDYFMRLLSCPSERLTPRAGTSRVSLDSLCNLQ